MATRGTRTSELVARLLLARAANCKKGCCCLHGMGGSHEGVGL